MRLVAIYDHRFVETPDGSVWSRGNLGYDFLARYLQVFEEVTVLCRLEGGASPPDGAAPADGPGVTFVSTGTFEGPREYVTYRRTLHAEMPKQLEARMGTSAFLIRAPTVTAATALRFLRRRSVPYAIEVVGDPVGQFGWGRPAGPVGVVLAWFMAARLRRQVRGAVAVGYVPSSDLRDRYPAASGAVTQEYSSLALEDEVIVPAPRVVDRVPVPLRIVTAGAMAWPYKGIDVLIDATRILCDEGQQVELVVLGDGRLRERYESRAHAAGLGSQVRFLGRIPPGRPVRDELDRADLFVLASLTEGLPRAMVEAMARGVPCVGTTAGGMPALLPPERCAVPGDAADLARVIRTITKSPAAMTAASEEQLRRSNDFRKDVTLGRARSLYEALALETEKRWARHR